MAFTHDIIIIGAGSGGLNVASFMNRIGLKVLLIDKTDAAIGGDCLNFGCVPSKALIHAAKIIESAKQAEDYGLSVKGEANFSKVAQYVIQKQSIIREHENAVYFRKKGMDVVLGHAAFSGKQSVTVNGKEYSAKKIVIATGSRPKKLLAKGAEKVDYLTNEEIFTLGKLPKKLLVLGTGPIGIELAQAFAQLGSKVSIVHRNDTFLKKEDPEISELVKERLQNLGVEFHFSTTIQEFTSKNSVTVEKNGKTKNVSFDNVLVALGRDLNIDLLDLEKANIQTSHEGKRLVIKDTLQTSNKHVFAIGDVVGGPMFTHAAEAQVGVLISNLLLPFKKKVSYDKFSWVTFTDPQIATFGLQEKQLKEKGISYKVLRETFNDDDRAIVDDAQNGLVKLFVAKNNILGGTMVSKDAGELSQELILAMSAGLPLGSFFSKVYPYPTATRINKKVISGHFANKLNSFNKSIMRFLYKL